MELLFRTYPNTGNVWKSSSYDPNNPREFALTLTLSRRERGLLG
jgi:hypothetical protein